MVEESCHPIFTQDPAHWMQYIYKKVRVLTGPSQEHVGHIYTVDPVTSSFVLIHFPPAAVSATSTAADVCAASSSSATTPNTSTASDPTPETSVGVSVIPGHAVVDVTVLQDDDDGNNRCSDGPGDENYEKIKARLDALFLNSKNSNLGFGDSGNIGIEADHLSEEALLERKDKLKEWLVKNRLPVQEQKCQDDGGDSRDRGKCLCVAGAVTILPPYGPGNCCSTNEIILSRIQNLIRNMPPTV